METNASIAEQIRELSTELFGTVEELINFERQFESIQNVGPSMLPDRPENPSFRLRQEIESRLKSNVLVDTVLQSESWSALFKKPIGGQPKHWLRSNGIVCSLSGGGSTPQFPEFLLNILRTAHLWARIAGDSVDNHSVAENIGKICSEIENLCNGQSIDIPVVHFLHGIGLPATTRVDLGGSFLLSLNEIRWNLLLDGREAYTPEYASESGCILVEHWPIWLLTGAKSVAEHHKLMASNAPPEKIAPKGTKIPKSAIHNLQSAFALAETDPTKITGPQVMSTRPLNFLSGCNVSFRNNQARLIPRKIDGPCVDNTARIYRKLTESDLTNLTIALNRYRMATTERQGPIDKLIDAAIGLESLFGDASFVNTSIAVGMSNLLGRTQEERKELYETSKRLYGKRCTIVHGGKLKDGVDSHALSQEMLTLLGRSIIAYLDEPDLIALSTHERTKELAIRDRKTNSDDDGDLCTEPAA